MWTKRCGRIVLEAYTVLQISVNEFAKFVKSVTNSLLILYKTQTHCYVYLFMNAWF